MEHTNMSSNKNGHIVIYNYSKRFKSANELAKVAMPFFESLGADLTDVDNDDVPPPSVIAIVLHDASLPAVRISKMIFSNEPLSESEEFVWSEGQLPQGDSDELN
jgi:hypothetical protein